MIHDDKLDALIEERGSTHGPWRANMEGTALIADGILSCCETALNRPVTDMERGAIMLAANKVSRMFVGDHTVPDHIEDFANYLRFYKTLLEERGPN